MKKKQQERKKLLGSALVDIFLAPAVAGFTLSCVLAAAANNTIIWRGITYRLTGRSHVKIEKSDQ